MIDHTTHRAKTRLRNGTGSELWFHLEPYYEENVKVEPGAHQQVSAILYEINGDLTIDLDISKIDEADAQSLILSPTESDRPEE